MFPSTESVTRKVYVDTRGDNYVNQQNDSTSTILFNALPGTPTGFSLTQRGVLWAQGNPSILKFEDNTGTIYNVAGSGVALVGYTLAKDTALGVAAGSFTAPGLQNTAIGANSLTSNHTGANDTAVGYNALASNVTGNTCTAVGVGALQSNTTGTGNVALGSFTLQEANASGNVAIGASTLTAVTSGGGNTACGQSAMAVLTTGGNNIGIGINSCPTTVGGSNNIAIGNVAGEAWAASASNNICIGSLGNVADSATARIGDATTLSFTYLSGTVVSTGAEPTGTGITAANMLTGICQVTGTTATTDAGATIDTAFPGIIDNNVIKVLVVNSGSSACALSGGSNVTFLDTSASIPAHTSRVLYFVRTAANTYTVN